MPHLAREGGTEGQGKGGVDERESGERRERGRETGREKLCA